MSTMFDRMSAKWHSHKLKTTTPVSEIRIGTYVIGNITEIVYEVTDMTVETTSGTSILLYTITSVADVNIVEQWPIADLHTYFDHLVPTTITY